MHCAISPRAPGRPGAPAAAEAGRSSAEPAEPQTGPCPPLRLAAWRRAAVPRTSLHALPRKAVQGACGWRRPAAGHGAIADLRARRRLGAACCRTRACNDRRFPLPLSARRMAGGPAAHKRAARAGQARHINNAAILACDAKIRHQGLPAAGRAPARASRVQGRLWPQRAEAQARRGNACGPPEPRAGRLPDGPYQRRPCDARALPGLRRVLGHGQRRRKPRRSRPS